MNEPDKIKEKIKKELNELALRDDIIIKDLTDPEAYGHSAGTPLEGWIKEQLSENGWKIYFPNEIVSEVFNNIKDIPKIRQFLEGTFWAKLLVTKKQFENFEVKKPIIRWQQEGADLVLFYGEDIMKEPNKMILLNVKSHESSRKSRDPNIMSAQRLLEYLDYIISKESGEELLDFAELWFVGVNYLATTKGGKIGGIFVKDLFKLDTSLIPQINFDAAIQIQWHVENMIEKEQTNKEFTLSLSEEFFKRWTKHSTQKENKYKILTERIKKKLS